MRDRWGTLCAWCVLLLAISVSVGDADTPIARPAGPGEAATTLLDPADRDTSVRAGDDFFRFANGAWIDRQTIPPDMSIYRTKEIVEKARDEEVRTLLDDVIRATDAPPGSSRQKIRDFYLTAIDSVAIERDGLRHLQGELTAIDRIGTLTELQDLLADLHTKTVNALFAGAVGTDLKDSHRHVYYLSQSGLGLPASEDYLDPGEKGSETRQAYQRHIEAMMALLGEEPARAAADAEAALLIEARLAAKYLTRAQQRDLASQYNPMSLPELAALCPAIDWNRYFERTGVAPRTVVISRPEYMGEVGRMLSEISLRDWRAYLRWRLVDVYADCLGQAFVQQNWRFFGAFLNGEESLLPRDERARRLVNDLMGEILGALYVERFFPPESKARLERVFANVKDALAARIRRSEWMSPATQTAALRKLEAMRIKVGYPDKWHDHSALRIERDGFLPNVRRVAQHRYRATQIRLEQPVDRELWPFPPQTANAGYSVLKNEIIFPAGILRPPVFYAHGDEAMNYGAIGFGVAHEMIHGFDDQGRKFDAEGNLNDWWTEADETAFRARAQSLAEQYGAFTVCDTVRLNAKLTLGENIADLGGLSVALDAYHQAVAGQVVPPLDGLTGEQRFFFAFAQFFRGKIRDSALLRMVREDRHPWGAFRVNGTLPNMAEFYTAFAVAPGDRLYRRPEHRARIW